MFASSAEARDALARTGYLVDDDLATLVFLGDTLGKPILLEDRVGEGCGCGHGLVAGPAAVLRGAR